jgi:hypothetical protein
MLDIMFEDTSPFPRLLPNINPQNLSISSLVFHSSYLLRNKIDSLLSVFVQKTKSLLKYTTFRIPYTLPHPAWYSFS